MHEAIPPGREYANRSQCSDATQSGGFDRRKDRKYLDLIARIRHRNIGDLMRYVNFEPGEKAFFAERILEVNGLHEMTKAVVETARETLVIGEA